MPYRFLDDIATADIAFEAWGDDLSALFQIACDATLSIMLSNIDKLEHKVTKSIELENRKADLLLFEFLNEIIYYKDAEQVLLRANDIDIRAIDDGYVLKGSLWGDKIDSEKHDLLVDIKAITLHGLYVKHTTRGWSCRVVVEV